MNHQAKNLTQHLHKFINFFLWHNGTTSGKHPVKGNEALSIFLEKFAEKISLHISAFDNLPTKVHNDPKSGEFYQSGIKG